MARTTLRRRIAAWADRVTADADAQASDAGLTVSPTSRHGRVYTDPRLPALRAARAAGCTHLPVHLDPADCSPATAGVTGKAAA